MQKKHWIIKYRLLIIILFSVFTLISLLLFPRLNVNPDLDSYVPENIENQIHLRKLDSIFGGSEIILVMLKADDVMNIATLNRLKVIANDLSELDGVDRCISPFDSQDISIEDGFMVMKPILDSIPTNPDAINTLKLKIQANSMASRFFVPDYSVVSLIIIKDAKFSDKILIDQAKAIISNHPGSEEILMGGLPFIRYSISESIKDDIILLLPLALLLMVFMLYFSFREWKGVYIPFIIVIMSMILSFGVMALLGWQISLITILLPIMLIAIANDYGIHMIARYQELTQIDSSLSMEKISTHIYKDLKWPIIITGLTTIGGILGLLTHTMIPAAQLGILAAIGIAFALILSIWFLPALLSYFTPLNKSKKVYKLNLANKWLNRFSKLVTNYPRRVIVIYIIIGLIGFSGLFLLRVDTNIEGYFLGKSDVSKSVKLINEKYGGAQYISVLFTGDVLDPELLKRIEFYEEELLKDPSVGTVSSPVTLVKELSKGFYNENELGYNQIPSTADEVYQFIEIFAMGGNEESIEQFMDYNYENSRLLISLNDGSNREAKRLLSKIQTLMIQEPNFDLVAGPCLTKVALADMVVTGQIKSLIFAMAVIFILLSFVFRSIKAGIISALPLTVSILVLFGLMGLFGIAVDIATALLSSIMIGVGIDYTIHFLWRFKEERANGLEHKIAAHITLTTTGRGIIFNAISVIIGFLALTLSNFAPLRFFGALVVISITACLLSALILIPSIVILIKPKFLEKTI